MKMKKFIASVLVAATAFGLVACGNSGSGDSAKSDSSAKSTDKKEIVYGKSQGPMKMEIPVPAFPETKSGRRCGL